LTTTLNFSSSKIAAMTILSELVLVESPSARNHQLANLSHERADEILNKIKSLYFALWQGTGIATTEQLAEFFEVESPATLRQVLNRHKQERLTDGRSASAYNKLLFTPKEVILELALHNRSMN
jgi:uncharacterized protein YcaQ